MEIKVIDILNKILAPGPDADRLEVLLNVLDSYNISYNLQKIRYPKSVNVVVKLNKPNTSSKKFITLGAHYDTIPGSLGINDNSCSIAVLIKFILTVDVNKLKHNIEVVFFDKEETGMHGSYYYAKRNKRLIKYAIILDVIGFGDNLFYCGDSNNIFVKNMFRLKNILPSDNMSFISNKVRHNLIVAIPITDVVFMPESSTFYLNSGAKFYKSFHNRELDNNIEIINFELLENTVNKLIKNSYGELYEKHI